MPDDDSSLDRARRLRSVEEAARLYAEWAPSYDDDVFGRLEVTGSARVAELLADHVTDRSTSVVDLGCGTGAVGVRLAELGFDDITGIDLSPEMLEVAERTGAYRELAVADLASPIDLGTRFGAAVSAGTFTSGHVGARAVPGVLRLLRPGSFFVWAVAPASWPAFQRSLTDGHVTILRSATEPIRPRSDDRSHMVVAHLAPAPSDGPARL